MIVTCHQCATQFHLDDAKVPEEGIRVRCSRCKFAFLVESPRGSELARADSIARDAFPSAATPTEDVQTDESDSDSDWKFSEEVATAAANEPSHADRDAAAAAVDDLLGPPGAAVEPRFDDLEGREAFELDVGDLEASDFDAATTSDFGEVGLDVGEILRAPDEVHEDLSIDPEAAEVESGLAALDPESEPTSGNEAPGRQIAAGTDPPAIETAVATAPDPDAGAAFEDAAEIVTPAQASESPTPEAFDRDCQEAAAPPAWVVRTRAVLGWAVVGSLCAAAMIVGLVPGSPASPAAPRSVSVAGFDAQAIRASWIDNAVAGPIYVVSGSLRAASATPAAGVELRVRLLDRSGEPIAAASAAVGPSIPMTQLREARPIDLRNRQANAAQRFARQMRQPGERYPFHAVFEGIPAGAAAFEFWAAEAGGTREPDSSGIESAYTSERTTAPTLAKAP